MDRFEKEFQEELLKYWKDETFDGQPIKNHPKEDFHRGFQMGMSVALSIWNGYLQDKYSLSKDKSRDE